MYTISATAIKCHHLATVCIKRGRSTPFARVSAATMPSSLLITGFGVKYPPNLSLTEDLDKLAYKWYPASPALDKVLSINRRTGIKSHSLIYPLLDLPYPPSIKEVSEIFNREGIPLSKAAAQAALTEAGLTPAEVTHVVATTCTDVSNPGFDSRLAQELGLRPSIERVLLSGVGCAGGLAALRLAASLCQSAAWRGEPAHVLVVACEITSTMRRDELELIAKEQQVRIGITLFGDGAAALVLSVAPTGTGRGIYELVNWAHLTVPDTQSDLRIDVDTSGFKPTLSPRIPTLTGKCVPLLYDALFSTLPAASTALTTLPPPSDSRTREFDWAVHPGGAAILKAVQDTMAVDREHLKASWDVYESHGNTSSVTVLSVLDVLRRGEGREWVVSMAFGPGVTAEGALLRRLSTS
ncbi:unnamed protein product [Mycena citricolor]|uniref:Chalcone synthase n=1 Tax=Mycena citricolor TaxID=2018698 RepID=A0AAD2K853_9AGAR|nr:unnamed protein product [Mycena citricolor]